MADQEQLSQAEKNERARVERLEKEQLAWTNILRLNKEVNKATKDRQAFAKELDKFSKDEVARAEKFITAQETIKRTEKSLAEARKKNDQTAVAILQTSLKTAAKARKETGLQQFSESVLLKQREMGASRAEKSLITQKKLIQDINKQRGIGASFLDKFRSEESIQRRIDIARIKAGGGANATTAKGGGAKAGEQKEVKLEDLGRVGAFIASLKGPVNELGNQIKNAVVAPFASAANLLTGDSIGMGGGKANAAGATSILGGLKDLASTLPFIGGMLGGLLGVFKGVLDAVLGIDEANFRVGRSLNISATAANDLRKRYDGIAATSGNLVVNSTRLLQSQIEINKQLGTNKELSADILVNDVKLRDIAGLEAESRQQIANSSIITGRNAAKLTQSVMGTVGVFNRLVGTSFKFNDIMGEASKLTGVMGLTFAKYPERITKAVLATKTLGFELKQLDQTADSFLDFEGSISKEMEAQVLTGKDMNLTRAREAALNNDNATLAQEITKNVGDANAYLKMNRIQQEAIASSVGMTRDSLADVLKKQELYSKLGATDVNTFNKRIELLQKQGKTQEEISAMIGKDAYNTFTQVSTAEKLTEIMERLKIAVVDFVKNTGLFDFLTKPEKINQFIGGLTDKLGGFIKWIGNAIATLLEGLGKFVHIFSSDTGEQLMAIAAQARGGSAELGTSIQAIGANLGGTVATSISGTKEAGVQKQQQQAAAVGNPSQFVAAPQPMTANLYLDGQQITTAVFRNANQTPGLNKK